MKQPNKSRTKYLYPLITMLAFLSFQTVIVNAATLTDTFDLVANYVYDATKVMVDGGVAKLKNLFAIANHTASGDFTGTHDSSLSSYQTNKITITPSYTPIVSTKNLLGYWSFDEGSSTTAKDIYGGLDGVVSSGDWTTGKFSNGISRSSGGGSGALDLNAKMSQVTVASQSQITVAAWIKVTTFGSSNNIWAYFEQCPAAASCTGSKVRLGLGFLADRLTLNGWSNDTTNSTYAESAATMASLAGDGLWHHIAGVFNADTDIHDVYLDGVLVTSGSRAAAVTYPSATGNEISVGWTTGGTPANFAMDDFLLYKGRALTASEIAAIHGAGRAMGVTRNYSISEIMSGAVSVWRLDDSDQTVADSVGSNTGTRGVNSSSNPTDDPTVMSATMRVGTGAMRFDGTAQYIALTNSSTLSPGADNASLSIWARLNTLGAARHLYSDAGASSQAFELSVNSSNNVVASASDGTNTATATSALTLSKDTWYHFVMARNGNSVALYINGALAASGAGAPGTLGTVDVSAGNVPRIGAKHDGTSFWSGDIDSAAYFGRTLVADEVLKIYSSRAQYTSQTIDGVVSAPKWESMSMTKSLPWGEALEKPPVAYWIFEKGSGTNLNNLVNDFTDATDGSTHDGTFVGAPTWTDNIPEVAFSDNKSITFNGTSDYIDVPDNAALDPTGSFSFSVWFYKEANESSDYLFDKNTFGSQGYAMDATSTGLFFRMYSSGPTANTISGSTTITTGVWHHAAVTYNVTNNELRLFLDGKEDATFVTAGGPAINSTSALRFGARANGTAFPLNGKLDEVAYFNYTLNPGEIAALAAGKKRPRVQSDNYEANLVGLWHLDNEALDYSGANHGTETGYSALANAYSYGVMGAALNLDGFNDYVNIANNSVLNPTSVPFAVSAWIRTSANNKIILQKRSNPHGYELSISNGGYAVFKRDAVSVTGTLYRVDDGQWHHVLGSVTGTGANQMVLYVDSKADGTNTVTTNNAQTAALNIGTESTPSTYFSGNIDEVALFNTGLTANQVLDIYRRTAARVTFQVQTGASDPASSNWSGGGVPDKKPAAAVWHFNQSSGSATDSVGSNTGTLNGNTSYVTGFMGNAVSFDGSGDYVGISPVAIPNTNANLNYTISLWFKSTSTASLKVLYGEYNTGLSTPLLQIRYTGNTNIISISHTDDDGVSALFSPTLPGVKDGKWHHVVMVKNGSALINFKIYYDGVFIGNATGGTNGVGATTVNSACIGAACGTALGNYFTGEIDEVAVWQIALSGREVWDLYRSGLSIVGDEASFVHGQNKERYFRYRAQFETLDETLTPDFKTLQLRESGAYTITAPYIQSQTFSATYFPASAFTESVTVPASTAVKYQIYRPSDGMTYYWNGSAWNGSTSANLGDYSKTNTASEMNTNLVTLDNDAAWPANTAQNLKVISYLKTTDGVNTPTLNTITATYQTATIAIASPNAGTEVWRIGAAKPITWTVTGTFPTADLTLEYAPDGLTYSGSIATGVDPLTHNEEKMTGAVGVWHLDGTAALNNNDTQAQNTGLTDAKNGVTTTAKLGAGGLAWSSGKITGGAGVTFDDVDDYIEIPDSASLSPTTAVSLSAWVKTSVATGTIVSKGTSGQYDYILEVDGNGYPAIRVRDSSGTGDSVTSSVTVHNDAWHHVVGIFDGDWLLIYVDGVLRGSKDSARTNIRDTAGNVMIGDGSNHGFFGGSIDDVAIFNRALTASEIKAINDAGTSPGFIWTVPAIADSASMKVRVRSIAVPALNDSGPDGSDANFSITTFNLTSPNGGSAYKSNSYQNITWNSGAYVTDGITLEYSTDSGVTWFGTPIATGRAAKGDDLVLYGNPESLTTPSGPLSVWHLEDGSGTNVADAVGGRTLTLTVGAGGTITSSSGSWTTGKIGSSAILLDGTDDYLSYSTSMSGVPSGAGARTFAAWARCDSCAGGNHYGVMSAGNTGVLSMHISNSSGRLQCYDAGGVRPTATGTTDLKDSNWHHLACSYDGSTVKAYVDGKLEGLAAATYATVTSGGVIYAGRTSATHLKGAIDDVSFFNRALTDAELSQLAGRGYAWLVPSAAASGTVKVKARHETLTDLFDESDTNFKVAQLDVTAPNGNEYWTVGSNQNITWTKSSNLADFKVEYSTNGGGSWATALSTNTGDVTTFAWNNIPQAASGANTVVRVCAQTSGYTTICDQSDVEFSIPQVTVTAPNGGEQWQVGKHYYITWTETQGTPNDLALHYDLDGNFSSGAVSIASDVNSPKSLSPAPLTYWRLDGNGTDAMSVSNVTASGAIFTPGVFGSALQFDGTDDYATFSDTGFPAGAAARTVSGWVKVKGTPTSDAWFFKYGTSASHDFLFGIDSARRVQWDSQSTATVTATTVLNLNTWYHVAATYDGTNIKLFLDGNLEVSAARTLATVLSSGVMGAKAASTNLFNGQVDELSVFNRVLSTGEIAQLAIPSAQMGKGPDPINVTGSVAGIWHADASLAEASASGASSLTLSGAFNNSNGYLGSGALTFDGVDDIVSFSTLPAATNQRSWSFWVNPEAAAGTNLRLFTGGTNFILFNGSTRMVNLYNNTLTVSGATAIPTSQWSHVAVTLDNAATTGKIYINGALDASSTSFTFTSLPTSGSFGGGSSGPFKGQMDEMAIYNRVLTPLEVAQLAGKASYKWTVPAGAVGSATKVRVRSASLTTIEDLSDAAFKVSDLTITSPNSGEVWRATGTKNITWNFDSTIANVKLEYSTDSGVTWPGGGQIITSSTTNNGSFSWNPLPNIASSTVRIRVSGVGAGFTSFIDDSNADFTIAQLNITAPNGSNQWQVGSSKDITWTATAGILDDLVLEYSIDGGSTWPYTASGDNTYRIATGLNRTSGTPYPWTIPDNPSAQVRVRVKSAGGDASLIDASDADFKIAKLAITSPVTNVTWPLGSTKTITWNRDTVISNVKIEYSDTGSGGTWVTVSENEGTANDGIVANDGSFSWVVEGTTTAQARVRITGDTAAYNQITTMSTVDFSKSGSIISVVEPDNSPTLDIWAQGSIKTIKWAVDGPIPSGGVVKIQYYNASNTWEDVIGCEIVDATTGSTGCNWTVASNAVRTDAQIRILAYEAGQPDWTPDATTGISPIFKVTAQTTLIRPNGGEKWAAGAAHKIRWSLNPAIANVKLEYSKNNSTWTTIIGSTANPNVTGYSWTPALSDADDSAWIRVSDATDSDTFDVSDAPFKISAVAVTVPSATNLRYTAGSSQTVQWTSTSVDNVKIEYSKLGDFSDAVTLNATTASDGSESVTLPTETTTTAKIRVTDADATPAANEAGDTALIADVSDNAFALTGTITVTAPNTSASITAGAPYTITWTISPANANVIPNVRIYFQDVNNNLNSTYIDGGSAVNGNNVAAGSGSFSWTPAQTTTAARIRVSNADDALTEDYSNFQFPVNGIAVQSPSGGEIALVNQSFGITFQYSGSIDQVDIAYSVNNGTTWTPIVSNYFHGGTTDNPITYSGWTHVPDTITGQGKIRVCQAGGVATCGISAGNFSIRGVLSMTTPADTLIGQTRTLQWTNVGSISDVRLEFSKSGNFGGDEFTIATLNGLTGSISTTNQSYNWNVTASPDPIAATGKVRVVDLTSYSNSGPKATTSTSGAFSVAPTITVTTPATAWAVYETNRVINWSINSPNVTNVKIEYVPQEGTQNGQAITIAASVANTGSYTWPSVPDLVVNGGQDPQVNRDILNRIRVTDIDAGHPAAYGETGNFTVKYYQISWQVRDLNKPAVFVTPVSVADNSGWNVGGDSLVTSGGVTRNYRYGDYVTTFSKSGWQQVSSPTWTADADKSNTFFMESDADKSVEILVKVQYAYDLSTDTFNFTWWLERGGVLESRVDVLQAARIDVYQNGSDVVLHTLNDATPNANGIYEATWASSGINTSLVYFAKGVVNYGAVGNTKEQTSGVVIDVREKAAIQTINTGIAAVQTSVAAVQASTSSIDTKIGSTADSSSLLGKAQALIDTIGDLSDAAGDDTVFGQVKDAQEKSVTILEEVQTKLPALIKSQTGGSKGGQGRMLNRDAKIPLGTTASIRFQIDTGLAPTVDIYDPKNNKIISGAAMTEVAGTKGIYNYGFKVGANFERGEYTVIVKESTTGFMDSTILHVVSANTTDEKLGASLASASSQATNAANDAKKAFQEVQGLRELLGSSGDTSIGNQLGEVTSLMGSIKRSVAVLTGGAETNGGQAITISSVHTAVLDVMKEVRSVASHEGINLDAVYEGVSAQQETAKQIQNMVVATEAAAKTTQEIIEKAQDKPVMTTWFENPSK